MYATRHGRARTITIAAALFVLTLTGCASSSLDSQDSSRGSQSQGAGAASLDAAINGSQRSSQARARDVYRHPKETLQFFDLGPTQAVLEIAPGGGWYTDILAPYLRNAGQLYEAQYLSTSVDLAAEDSATDAAYRRKLANAPSVYGNVVVGTLHAGQFNGFDSNERFDRVLTFRNIHNWIKDGQFDANLRAFYGALKHGGELGVEEHRARPGTTEQQMIDSGYVTEAFVIEHAKAAGFVLLARSEINANPKDTKDYPHGVWSLPPTYQGGDVDRSRFAAIGESDRMTLKFVKP
ncbi:MULTISPECIES: class I SAM-dependent methyltransferase [Paraburkholderia]|jgi:predicted methyltransferase|uniref:class I SAM-dependent methyltransferase n=1 Tax=Paraburkholderia TaxID=1822464 RepID=UPI001CAE32F3|nr:MULTISPECIES: methyltransferase [Paraburkholderia]GJH04297.1 class I SAM-dependent methyltransferase [Paraburkholderia terrae]GJH34059.1 class I SAM-dependent methyltransferase [Paraburkholderia hospita]CAG9271484.1 Methyltransferase [Paraburkholderia caribensis]